MASIKVMLTKIVDWDYPVFGMFEFDDISGARIMIREKLPVVLGEYDPHAVLPLEVALACEIISMSETQAVIDTDKPDGIENTQGQTRFSVNPEIVVP